MSFREKASELYRRGYATLEVGVETRARFERESALVVSWLGTVGAMRASTASVFSSAASCRRCRWLLAITMQAESHSLELTDPRDGETIVLTLTAPTNRCIQCNAPHWVDADEAMEIALDYVSTCRHAAEGSLPASSKEWTARRLRVERLR